MQFSLKKMQILNILIHYLSIYLSTNLSICLFKGIYLSIYLPSIYISLDYQNGIYIKSQVIGGKMTSLYALISYFK